MGKVIPKRRFEKENLQKSDFERSSSLKFVNADRCQEIRARKEVTFSGIWKANFHF